MEKHSQKFINLNLNLYPSGIFKAKDSKPWKKYNTFPLSLKTLAQAVCLSRVSIFDE